MADVENAIRIGTVTSGSTTAEVVRTFQDIRAITNPERTGVISVIKTAKEVSAVQ